MRRLFMLVLLVPAFCSVVFAQLGAIRDRGPHTLYGDIKVETEPVVSRKSRSALKSSSTSSTEHSLDARRSQLTDVIGSWI